MKYTSFAALISSLPPPTLTQPNQSPVEVPNRRPPSRLSGFQARILVSHSAPPPEPTMKSSRWETVEQKLQIESSEQIIETLTNDELKTAAELFVYLNMCPGTIKPWIKFYKDLFQTQSPDQIILTLNRLMKGTRTPQNEYFHNLGEKFLNRVKSLFPEKRNTESNGEAYLVPVRNDVPKTLIWCRKELHQ